MMSLLLASLFGTAHAVPMQLSQQGRLVDASGAAASGNHNLTFRLYNAGTGGTLLWNETVSSNFTNGYYSVVLGSDTINNPLEDSVLESGDLFIEIEIDSDGPLTPRSAVTSAPFARVAGKAQVADSADWSGLTSIPSDISDGDDDTVGALSCGEGEQAVYTNGSWACGNPVADVDADNRLAALETLVASLQGDLATTQSDLATTQSDLAAAQGDLSTANTTIASLESSLAGNNTDIASNTSSINALETDLTAAEASIATLQTDVSGISDNVLDMISVDTTWNIGSNGEYTNLVDAMAAARSVLIHPDATLTLQMDNDLHVMTESVNLNHPNGANINILGNSSDNSLVKLQFSGTGLILDEAHTFGAVQNLTLQGDGTGNGMHVVDGSTMLNAYNLVIEEFDRGIWTWHNSSFFCDGDILIQNNATHGMDIRYNSVLIHDSTGSITTTGNGSDGLYVTWGATGEAVGLDSYDNGNDGIQVAYNAAFYASEANFSNNGDYGAKVHYMSFLYGATSDYNSNGGHGLNTEHGAYAYAGSSTFNNNSAYGAGAFRFAGMRIENSTATGNYRGIYTSSVGFIRANGSTASGNAASQITAGSSSFGHLEQ